MDFGAMKIQMEGNKLKFLDESRILGVTVDRSLGYLFHIGKIYSRDCVTLRRSKVKSSLWSANVSNILFYEGRLVYD